MTLPARIETAQFETALGVPALEGMSLRDLWDFEDRLDGAKSAVGEYIDDEIRRLASEGWTQTQIAEECGRAQQTISDRMQRLGLNPVSNRGRPRITGSGNSKAAAESEGENDVVNGEVVEDDDPSPEPVGEPEPDPDSVAAPVESSLLRAQLIDWFAQGRVIRRLLDDGETLDALPQRERESLRSDAALMAATADRVKGELSS